MIICLPARHHMWIATRLTGLRSLPLHIRLAPRGPGGPPPPAVVWRRGLSGTLDGHDAPRCVPAGHPCCGGPTHWTYSIIYAPASLHIRHFPANRGSFSLWKPTVAGVGRISARALSQVLERRRTFTITRICNEPGSGVVLSSSPTGRAEEVELKDRT